MNKFKKIFELLNQRDQRFFFFLVILFIFMAFIEVLGVASIMPFIAILSNPQLIETNSFLNFIYEKSNIIGVTNQYQFQYLAGFITFFLLTLSLTVRALTNYVQVRFSLMQEYEIGKTLFESYLFQPYVWFLNHNSGDLGKNILSEVKRVMEYSIIPLISLLAQGAVTFFLILLLIIIDPILAMSVSFIFFIFYYVIFYLYKNYLSDLGAQSIIANKNRFTFLDEAFGSIKELKLRGLEKFYVNRFSIPAKKFASSHSLAIIIAELPKYLIEGVAFGGLIILVLTLMSFRSSTFIEIIPLLSLYAFAGYRLMPALQTIYSSLTHLSFSKEALDTLNKSLNEFKNSQKIIYSNKALPFKKFINLENISFKYPNYQLRVLRNINLDIPFNSKIGIIGKSGSGKTTLIDVILGLIEPVEGNLKVDNIKITYKNLRLWQNNINYVPQQIFLTDNSISENIAIGIERDKIDQLKIQQVSKISNIHEFITNELPEGYDTVVGEKGVRLSGGQKQRIGIARALYDDKPLIVLDEATNALDSETENKLINNIINFAQNKTLIVISHNIQILKNFDLIYSIENGKVINTLDNQNFIK